MSGYLLKKVNKNVQISEFRVSNHKNIIFRKAINLIHQLSFFLKNYHKYDFSCCYATYSFSCNKLARLASKTILFMFIVIIDNCMMRIVLKTFLIKEILISSKQYFLFLMNLGQTFWRYIVHLQIEV